ANCAVGRLAYSCVVLFILSILTACQRDQEGIKPQLRDLYEAVYSTATVQPREAYTVFPSVNGIIENSVLEEGKIVGKGEELIKIKNQQSDLNRANAKLSYQIAKESYSGEAAILKELEESIHSAFIKLGIDSLNYVRQAKLWERSIGSRQEFEAKKMAFDLSRNELDRLKNSFERTKKELATKLEQAENAYRISTLNSEDFRVESKLSGTVYEVYKEVGEAVTPQTPVALVGSSTDFIVELLIDEADISKIFPGQKTVITLDAYGKQPFLARISRILPTKDERSQTFTVEAIFVERPTRLFMGLSGEANI
ncbi:MAG: HlyD family efflux transporter periplasmic adaptor subunit, partial [Bacteroidota bacterium]